MPQSLFKEKFPHVHCDQTNVSLKTYTGEKVPVVGKANVKVDYEGQSLTLPLFVVQNDDKKMQVLMGRSWLEHLKINWNAVCLVTAPDKVAALRKKFPEPFRDSPGIVKNYEAHIAVKENS